MALTVKTIDGELFDLEQLVAFGHDVPKMYGYASEDWVKTRGYIKGADSTSTVARKDWTSDKISTSLTRNDGTIKLEDLKAGYYTHDVSNTMFVDKLDGSLPVTKDNLNTMLDGYMLDAEFKKLIGTVDTYKTINGKTIFGDGDINILQDMGNYYTLSDIDNKLIDKGILPDDGKWVITWDTDGSTTVYKNVDDTSELVKYFPKDDFPFIAKSNTEFSDGNGNVFTVKMSNTDIACFVDTETGEEYGNVNSKATSKNNVFTFSSGEDFATCADKKETNIENCYQYKLPYRFKKKYKLKFEVDFNPFPDGNGSFNVIQFYDDGVGLFDGYLKTYIHKDNRDTTYNFYIQFHKPVSTTSNATEIVNNYYEYSVTDKTGGPLILSDEYYESTHLNGLSRGKNKANSVYDGEYYDGNYYIRFGALYNCRIYSMSVLDENDKVVKKYVFGLNHAGILSQNSSIAIKFQPTQVVIGSDVTKIHTCCFENFSTLEKVYIPNSVKNIGEGIFKNNPNLHTVIYDGTATDFKNISKDNDWLIGNSYCMVVCQDDVLYYPSQNQYINKNELKEIRIGHGVLMQHDNEQNSFFSSTNEFKNLTAVTFEENGIWGAGGLGNDIAITSLKKVILPKKLDMEKVSAPEDMIYTMEKVYYQGTKEEFHTNYGKRDSAFLWNSGVMQIVCTDGIVYTPVIIFDYSRWTDGGILAESGTNCKKWMNLGVGLTNDPCLESYYYNDIEDLYHKVLSVHWSSCVSRLIYPEDLTDIPFSITNVPNLYLPKSWINAQDGLANRFRGCGRLNNLINPNGWVLKGDVSNMFYGCSGLSLLDASTWDITNVTNMTDMFANSSLNTVYVRADMLDKWKNGNTGIKSTDYFKIKS